MPIAARSSRFFWHAAIAALIACTLPFASCPPPGVTVSEVTINGPSTIRNGTTATYEVTVRGIAQGGGGAITVTLDSEPPLLPPTRLAHTAVQLPSAPDEPFPTASFVVRCTTPPVRLMGPDGSAKPPGAGVRTCTANPPCPIGCGPVVACPSGCGGMSCVDAPVTLRAKALNKSATKENVVCVP